MISVIGIELRKLAANKFIYIAPLLLILFLLWGMSGTYAEYQEKSARDPVFNTDPPPGMTLDEYLNRQAQWAAGNAQNLDNLKNSLIYPDSLGSILAEIQLFGGIIILVLAVSTTALEYRHGTVAQIIARGTRRRHLIIGKIAALSIVAFVWLIIGLSFGVALSLFYSGAIGPDSTSNLGPVSALLGILGLTWLTMLFFILAGVFLGTAIKNGMVAMGVGISLFVFDRFFITFGLPGSGPFLGLIRPFAPNFNIISLMQSATPGDAEFSGGYLLGWGTTAFDNYNEPGTAIMVLTAYAVIFIGASLYIMSRRELKVG